MDKLKALKKAVQEDDPEKAHCIYDDILKFIAKKYQPEVLKELDLIVKDVDFWFS